MKALKILPALIGVACVSFFTCWILFRNVPKAQPMLDKPEAMAEDGHKAKLHYVAVGDSLTEGIGDDTGRGGFVWDVADDLQDKFGLTSVEIDNYGVSGNRSDQILKRINEQEDMQKNIGTADFITLTVGGNDVMKVIKNNIFGLKVTSFTKPQKKYVKNLTEILATMRQLNAEAPIYVLSFYNPFYFNFPEITDMETVVSNWNQATEDVVDTLSKVYFIDIDALMTNGGKEEPTVGTSESETAASSENLNTLKNELLSDADNFHPNTYGYQLIAKKVTEELISTKDEWLVEDASDEK